VEDIRFRKTTVAVAGAATLLVALASLMMSERDQRAEPLPPRLVPESAAFFADPDAEARQWVDSHLSDPRAATINSEIVRHPQAVWFTTYDPGAIAHEVGQIVTAAARKGDIPVLVPYAIPHRDCGGPSNGGAPDIAAYRRWIDNFATGLGDQPAWVILEPDALAEAGCLSAAARAARFQTLAYAADTIRGDDPAARLYYDVGHSGWLPVATMVARLRMANANAYANGLALNVASFEPTRREITYGLRLIRHLRNRSLRLVIDTSRNGNGPPTGHCDPSGRVLGVRPTAKTGNAWVDAFLWIKPPGESDGCLAGPGTFLPDYAYQLATARPQPIGGAPAPFDRLRSRPPASRPTSPDVPRPIGGGTRSAI
jgi:endoglucanase